MSAAQESFKTTRDLEVVQIPEGFNVRLARGTSVRVTQTLGGTFTAMTEYGTMVRIASKDADAIGQTLAATDLKAVEAPKSPEEAKERVWEALRGVYDPEIPVNVVELGLVYKNEVAATPEGFAVDVSMTLTAPGCGMGDVLKEDAARRIKNIPGVKAAKVEMVVDPPWTPSMMSEAARLQLGL